MNVIRTWKRDLSVNRMTLSAACANLTRNAKLSSDEAYRLLVNGDAVETPLASFRIDDHRRNGESHAPHEAQVRSGSPPVPADHPHVVQARPQLLGL